MKDSIRHRLETVSERFEELEGNQFVSKREYEDAVDELDYWRKRRVVCGVRAISGTRTMAATATAMVARRRAAQRRNRANNRRPG